MVNAGVAIGGTLGTVGVILVIFVLLNSASETSNDGLIVSNGNHLEVVGEITSTKTNLQFSLIEIFEKTEESVVQVNVRTVDGLYIVQMVT